MEPKIGGNNKPDSPRTTVLGAVVVVVKTWNKNEEASAAVVGRRPLVGWWARSQNEEGSARQGLLGLFSPKSSDVAALAAVGRCKQ